MFVHICTCMYIYAHTPHTVNFFTCIFYVYACIHIACVCVYIHTCNTFKATNSASLNLALTDEHMMQCVCSRVSSKLSPARVSSFQDPVLTVVDFRCWLWSST